MSERPTQPRISVVIPTLNEAGSIDATLASVTGLEGVSEVIVVDGGSTDDTLRRARAHGAKVVPSRPGRGWQLRTGAKSAHGEILLFVHADSIPPPDAGQAIWRALEDPRVIGGTFSLRFAGHFFSAHLLTLIYRYLLPLLGLRYGDSGYFVWRSVYEVVGGFNPYPIFEDLDLRHRLRPQGRFVRLRQVMTTSSRRFEGRWFALVFARWMLMQVLYWIGVKPDTIARLYHPIRETKPPPAPAQLPQEETRDAGIQSLQS